MQPTLYLMMGYPGAGKTTTAQVIQQLTGAEHLWADHIRQKWFQKPTHAHQENLELYERLNQQTDQLLGEGKSVIFDTSFNFYKDRQRLREIAAKHGAKTLLLWVQVPLDTAHQRATVDGDKEPTRVFGNMAEKDFERLSSHVEEPRPDEKPIIVDGTKVTPEYIALLLSKN